MNTPEEQLAALEAKKWRSREEDETLRTLRGQFHAQKSASIAREELEKRRHELFSWGFPQDRFSEEIIIDLCTNKWAGLVRLGEKAGNNAWYLFELGIPAVMPLIDTHPERWADIVRLGEKAEEKAGYLFRYCIPAFIPLIENHPQLWPQVGQDLVMLGEKAGNNAWYLFELVSLYVALSLFYRV